MKPIEENRLLLREGRKIVETVDPSPKRAYEIPDWPPEVSPIQEALKQTKNRP